MSDKINDILQKKRILILGFGKEGQSSYQLLRSFFPELVLGIADQDDGLPDKHPQLKDDPFLIMAYGDKYLENCSSYDLVIKSPGIPYEKLGKYCDAEKITSQTDLFLRAYSKQVIGVTGTKGKSTTSSLIHHILKQAGRKVILSGNIGIPPLSPEANLDSDTIVVFEMSSHQLEHITIAPRIAIILNIFPEHLDHYKDFTAYKMAKFNISLLQTEDSKLIYNADDPIIGELLKEYPAVKDQQSFSLHTDGEHAAFLDQPDIVLADEAEDIVIPVDSAKDLPGEHNLSNMMAAMLACRDCGLEAEEIKHGLSTYERLEHRLELAGTFDGVRFYNDSIATIPEATIEALRTLEKVELLILGGHDRGLDYSILQQWLLSHPVPVLLFMGDAGGRMYNEWKQSLADSTDCILVSGMKEALQIAGTRLSDGDVCLLSPAAASYGMFRNFEERGDLYKKMAAEFKRLPSGGDLK